MCGFAGIVHPDSDRRVETELLVAMRDALLHRGPDDSGVYFGAGIGLASRRLSILDLSENGRMPMATEDGRFWIAYNGEVYNHRDLRPALESAGHRFRSRTDTEVVLRLYAEHGPAMLPRLNGMFTLAIWDAAERTLLLARDRLGVKPLYYWQSGGELRFASEQKALFASGVEPRVRAEAWPELVCFRYAAGEDTPFTDVRRLLPGHSLIWKDGVVRTHRWWNLGEQAMSRRCEPQEDPSRWFRQTFDDAVGLRRISDVPVGVLLSGGLDSSSVAASLAFHSGAGSASFTVRFADPAYDESGLARQTAAALGLQYCDLELSGESLADRLEEASWLNDEPLAHGNDVHLLAIARFAKPRVTVLLSGEGADETLGGYVRYRPFLYPGLLRGLRPVLPPLAAAVGIGGRVGKLSRFLSLRSLREFVLWNAADVLPEDLGSIGFDGAARFPFRERILEEARRYYPGELVRQAMYLDQHTFLCSVLDRNDRMTMGASIECRVPFLDYRLVEGLAALPTRVLFAGGRSKALLRDSCGSRLPQAIRKHRKWGFGVPWKSYLRNVPDLRELVVGLPDSDSIREAPVHRARVRETVRQFLSGDDRPTALIRQLVMMAAWRRGLQRRAHRSHPQSSSPWQHIMVGSYGA